MKKLLVTGFIGIMLLFSGGVFAAGELLLGIQA